MTDKQHAAQGLRVRNIGPFNTIGVMTLIRKEVARFLNVYMQTLLAPMVTTLLFYMVFGITLHKSNAMIGDMPYLEFLAPGLIMMSVAQNAFANTSSSLMISKVQGNIVDLLMPPLSPFEIMLAYVTAGILRGLYVGVGCFIVLIFFVPLDNLHLPTILLFGVLGSMMMALLGIITGIFAEKFDGLAAITNFIIMPLTFLSGTFYSINALPPFWQEIIHMNPFYFMIDGFRAGIIGVSDSSLLKGSTVLFVTNFGLMIYAYALLLTGYKFKH